MKKLAFLFAFFCAIWATFDSLKVLSQIYNTVSISTQAPLTNEQMRLCEEYAEENMLLLTFTKEKSAVAYSELKKTDITAIYFKGAPENAFGAKYFKGEAPYSFDPFSCSVSRELANEVFGSENILGLSLLINDKEYKISGIFDGHGQKTALLNGLNESGFSHLEAAGLTGSKSISTKAMLAACGISAFQIIYASSISKGAQLLLFLPVLCAALPFMKAVLSLFLSLSSFKKDIFLFLTLLAFAALLPLLLSYLPTWLLPPMLSSKDAWAQIFGNLKTELLAYLGAVTVFKDVCARVLLIKAAAFAGISALLSCIFCKQTKICSK